MDWLADRFFVYNDRIPTDFFEQLTSCSKACQADECSYCKSLYEDTVKKQLKMFKDLH